MQVRLGWGMVGLSGGSGDNGRPPQLAVIALQGITGQMGLHEEQRLDWESNFPVDPPVRLIQSSSDLTPARGQNGVSP